MVWYGLEWFDRVWFFKVGGMFGNVLEYSRMSWETPKSFLGGGGIFAIIVSTQVQTS